MAIASRSGHASTVRLLSNLGSDIHWPTKAGVTALFVAAHGGHDATVKVLLELGCDCGAMVADGWTPALAVAEMGSLSTLELLANYGADLDVTTKAGSSALGKPLSCQIVCDDATLYFPDLHFP